MSNLWHSKEKCIPRAITKNTKVVPAIEGASIFMVRTCTVLLRVLLCFMYCTCMVHTTVYLSTFSTTDISL